jgi:hypothetical protein
MSAPVMPKNSTTTQRCLRSARIFRRYKIVMPSINSPTGDSEAVNVRMERPQIEALDNWRRGQADLPSRPEAIRRLAEQGLGAAKSAKSE